MAAGLAGTDQCPKGFKGTWYSSEAWTKQGGSGTTSGGPGGKGPKIDLRKHPNARVVAAGGGSGLNGGDTIIACPNPAGDCGIKWVVADTGGAVSGCHIDFFVAKAPKNWNNPNVLVSVIGRGGDPLTDPCKQIPGLCGPGAPGAPGIDNPLKDVATALANIVKKLFDPQTWLDIGKMLLGIVAVLMGVSMLIKGSATSLITQPPARAARAIVAAGQAAA